jgi:hypothetical protein
MSLGDSQEPVPEDPAAFNTQSREALLKRLTPSERDEPAF